MIAIRNVVCPVDFSGATNRQLTLAVDVCRAFGARLVLLHNVTDLSVGAGVGWMWRADQPSSGPISVDDQLRALGARVPKEIPVETCITRGAVTEAVLRVSEAAEADLVVLSAHAGKTADHASVIEFMLEHSERAVLALHDQGGDIGEPRFMPADDEHHQMQTLLVPVNLGADAHAQMEVACDLARLFPLRLHVLHVLLGASSDREGRDVELIRSQLQALVPDEVKPHVTIHIETGELVPMIVETARHLAASCIVMGEHTRMPVKRWLTQNNARAVLHEAHCPVWYVPSTRTAGKSLSRLALSNEKSILWGNV